MCFSCINCGGKQQEETVRGKIKLSIELLLLNETSVCFIV